MKRFLAAVLCIAAPFAVTAQSQGGEESVFRQVQAQTHPTTPRQPIRDNKYIGPLPQQPIRDNKYIGPLEYRGMPGALIDNLGDSRAARARIIRKKRSIEAERAAGIYDPLESYILNGQPVANTHKRDGQWYSDSFYDKHEDASRVRLDAWTFQQGFRFNALVLSCVYDRESQTGGQLKFFVKGLEPIGALGATSPVVISIASGTKKDTFRMKGMVSHVRATNIHINIDDQNLVTRMRAARTFRITVQSMTNPRPVTMEFSLMGFTAASTNTIANCMGSVQ